MRNSDIFGERNISVEPPFPSDFLDRLQPGAFSTTSLRKRGRTFPITVREASYALELNKSAPTGYERVGWLGGCLTQQDSARRSAV
jgi:hypothetical protein